MYLGKLASWDSEDTIDANQIYLPPEVTGGAPASASWPQSAATGLNQYAGIIGQGIQAYTAIRTADATAQTQQALAARGIVPAGYANARPPVYAYPGATASFSPFPANGSGGTLFNSNTLLALAGVGLAAFIAFGSK